MSSNRLYALSIDPTRTSGKNSWPSRLSSPWARLQLERFRFRAFSRKYPESLQEVSSSANSGRGFTESFQIVSSHGTPGRQLVPVVEHKGIGGHAPAETRAPVRCFKRLHGQTESRVRLPFVCHVAQFWPLFQKLSENTQKVSESFSFEPQRDCSFGKFQKVSIWYPAATPPNGS